VERVGEQDNEAIKTIYQRYRAPLTSYVWHAVAGDFHYAEDIVQETMMRAWRQGARLDSERAGPWLYTVAHNLIVSGHRSRGVRPAEVPIDDRDFPIITDEIEGALQRWQVTEALRALRQEYRTVILELFYYRRTFSEAAHVLGIPLGTVKSRSFYALRALRRTLEQQGVTSR
jgi:RNA polymerase sigma-70 factor, ECF subfamily